MSMDKINVKIEKAVKGYFLTIGDEIVNNCWAVTEEELRELRKQLNDIFKEEPHPTP